MASNAGSFNPQGYGGQDATNNNSVAPSFQVPHTPNRRLMNAPSMDVDHQSVPAPSAAPSRRAERMKNSSQRFSTQIRSTPRKTDDTRDSSSGQSSKQIGKALKKSMGEPIAVGDSWISDTFVIQGVLDQGTINAWLEDEKTSSVYHSMPQDPDGIVAWHPLYPETGSDLTESDLYSGAVQILDTVLAQFCPTGKSGVRRQVKLTANKKFAHKDPGENETSPDIVVCATGPSFERPEGGKKCGYSNVLTYIDVKLDSAISHKVHEEQLAVYSRQVFAHQPNRLFVRGLLMSERRAQLFQFDRAGVQATQLIDIHQNPDLFVLLVAGVCGTDERRIGFDDTISWTIVNGKKVDGTLRMPDADWEDTMFILDDVEPIAHDYDIRGRATTCWAVRHPIGDQRFVVKDTWSSDDRRFEFQHLLKAQTLPGVCRIVSHQQRERICDLRCPTTVPRFFNRVAERILMEAYGEQVESFNNLLQLLEVLRDAVDGHAYLYENDILHRDISDKNILIGREGAPDGYKGILIDLSVALDFGPNGDPYVTKEARSGSRFFQSCNILGFLTKLKAGEPPAHDYLDDLEAIFYVLCGSLFKKLPNGRDRIRNSKARNVVKGWDAERAEDALPPKALLFNPGCTQKQAAIDIVEKSWGPVCKDLFQSYLEWVYDIQQKKANLIQDFHVKQAAMQDGKEAGEYIGFDEPESDDEEELAENITSRPRTDAAVDQGVFAPLLEDVGQHYDQVLDIFTIAISSLRTKAGLGAGRIPKRRENNMPSKVPGFGRKAQKLS
ncbi:hypothetical protein FA13DRAFT_1778872 [Coprinellus micaceus]|uniref:Fungal-type protein kinase domain-containing protein n=1 Tax=Coprinellus micaceus TaxID=71717 RepID=A0A4Y7SKF0_COPMI|nr:hypothetical protein FA13DRAFT_1778872 [Coprinellus micaceus]